MSKYLALLGLSFFFIPNILFTQISQQWMSRFSHLSGADDFALFTDIDNSRNIYVAGISDNNFIIIKYNQFGDKLWQRDYKPDEFSEDNILSGFKVDINKNVYLTGSIISTDTTYDILTIKYNSDGILQWAVNYSGAGKTDDISVSLTVDVSGNVYVSGYNYNPVSKNDFILIRYKSNGVQQWVRRTNGSGNHDDIPVAITTDNLRNIYITGYSYNPESFIDFFTVKFDSTGLQNWAMSYDGGIFDEDIPISIDVDSYNNIYVTGSSYGDTSGLDYALVKYNSLGQIQKVSKYNSPFNGEDVPVAAKVTSGGSVFVTGYTEGLNSYDYLTMKFSADGTTAWATRFDNSSGGDDFVSALTIDGLENVYVTGTALMATGQTQINTIKYNALGVQHWLMPFSLTSDFTTQANGILIDPLGNLTVIGTGFTIQNADDILLIRYNVVGGFVWVKNENIISNNSYEDYPNDMVNDNLGNTYVAGASYDIGTLFDFIILKYNSDGDTLWTARYDGPSNGNDEAIAVGIDPLKNIYVTGTSFNLGSEDNIVTIKYNPNGIIQWVQNFNGQGNNIDRAAHLAVDNVGNVYVVGYSTNLAGNYDIVSIKYNTSGVQQWVSYFNSSNGMNDIPAKIKVDKTGNVYVSGYCSTQTSMNNIVTIKYNSNGSLQWAQYYNGSANENDVATSLALDSLGNVYICGLSEGNITQSDIVTLKYNPAGVKLWEIRYNGNGNGMDYPKALEVLSSGEVYVGGWSLGSGTFADAVIIKYSTNGSLLWENRYNGADNDYDYLEDMFVDNWGNVYTSCTSSSSNTQNDLIVMKYNPAGVLQWLTSYKDAFSTSSEVSKIKIDTLGNIFIAGVVYDSLDYTDIVTLKYRQSSFVSGKVFFDKNNNGVYESNEPPLVGWRIRLSGAKKDSVLTDVDGRFLFTNIPFGSFTISQLVKPGWLQTSPVGGGPTSFNISLGNLSNVCEFGNYSPNAFSYSMDSRWNIVSAPLRGTDMRKSIVFSSAVSNAFTYQNGYVVKDTLESLKGYWLKFADLHNLWIAGTEFTQDTVNVQTGWNLIGAVSVAVSTNSVTTIPSGIIQSYFYGYSSGYFVADSLKPVKGYWVKVNQNGKLIVRNTAAVTKSTNTELTQLNKMGKLIIADNENNSTVLFFSDKIDEIDLNKYELPPLPPSGNSDVRFEGDKLAFVPSSSKTQEITILLSGLSSPLTVSWEVPDSISKNFELYCPANPRSVYPLRGSNNITIQNEESSNLVLRYVQEGVSESIPQQFALEQNYPNPFNPTTEIKYQLPTTSTVVLKIYNMLGQEVATLVNEMQMPGYKSLKWDASSLPSGIYIYRLTAGKFSDVKKMTLIK